MSESVAHELQHEGYLARTVVLKLRYGDFTTLTRQTTLRVPTMDADAIKECALQLLKTHWNQKRALRLIGVGAHNFVEESGTWQMEFPA
jgi:DNA polymerase IV